MTLRAEVLEECARIPSTRPTELRVEMPWKAEDDGNDLYLVGNVFLGGRHPRAEFRVIDQRTDEVLDGLPDWLLEAAEEALINEAKEIWRKP